MLIKKNGHSLCSHNNTIFAIGGGNGTMSLSDCEQYDIESNAWTALPLLNMSRYNLATAILNG